jgi:hypothetical protein
MTFVRNHAKGIVACDFFVVVTATFRVLYVFRDLGPKCRSRCRRRSLTSNRTAPAVSRYFPKAVHSCALIRPDSNIIVIDHPVLVEKRGTFRFTRHGKREDRIGGKLAVYSPVGARTEVGLPVARTVAFETGRQD